MHSTMLPTQVRGLLLRALPGARAVVAKDEGDLAVGTILDHLHSRRVTSAQQPSSSININSDSDRSPSPAPRPWQQLDSQALPSCSGRDHPLPHLLPLASTILLRHLGSPAHPPHARHLSAAAPAPVPLNPPATPTAATPGPTYTVEVQITAFEKRYVQAASYAIQDLFTIDFAPKSGSTVSVRGKDGRRVKAPFGVMMGAKVRDVPINWKRSRFTLVKGPHIDKYGMEQFEIRRYRKVVTSSTNSAVEVHWLLEHLKMYEFTGVQLEVSVTSSTYLMPAAAVPPGAAGAGGGVLAQHRADIAEYLAPGAALAAAEAAGGPAARGAALGSALGELRGAVLDGLESRREGLKSKEWYQAWHQRGKAAAMAAPPPAPGRDAADAAEAAGAAGELSDPGRQRTSALLAALDSALLGLRFDALERFSSFRFHFATLVPGTTPLPAAQWMQAVLKYGQYQERLARYSQEAQLLLAYTGYTVFSHTLLHTLLKVWTQQTVAQTKPYLALPTQEETVELMQGAGARGGQRGGEGRATLFPPGARR